MTEPVLVADSLGKSFRGRRVLSAATLWARPGEVTVLFGRNGSGKTTAMRIAAGLLRADWGTVRFRGSVRHRPRLHLLAREGLMYVPQAGLLVGDWTVRVPGGGGRGGDGGGSRRRRRAGSPGPAGAG